jgi:hypothetical protein
MVCSLPATRRSSWDCTGRPCQRAGDLGAFYLSELEPHGKAAGDRVGYPLTLYFHRPLGDAQARQIDCSVWAAGDEVPGVLVVAQGEGERIARAPGLLAFLPLLPLPAGAEVSVLWRVPAGLLPEGEEVPEVRFRVRS